METSEVYHIIDDDRDCYICTECGAMICDWMHATQCDRCGRILDWSDTWIG